MGSGQGLQQVSTKQIVFFLLVGLADVFVQDADVDMCHGQERRIAQRLWLSGNHTRKCSQSPEQVRLTLLGPARISV